MSFASPYHLAWVRLEQDLGTPHLLGRALELLNKVLTNLAFFIRESDDLLFDHWKLPCVDESFR